MNELQAYLLAAFVTAIGWFFAWKPWRQLIDRRIDQMRAELRRLGPPPDREA